MLDGARFLRRDEDIISSATVVRGEMSFCAKEEEEEEATAAAATARLRSSVTLSFTLSRTEGRKRAVVPAHPAYPGVCLSCLARRRLAVARPLSVRVHPVETHLFRLKSFNDYAQPVSLSR